MTIEEHYNHACDLARKEVEKMARAILRSDPRLDSFWMANGLIFFETKDGKHFDLHERKAFASLDAFMIEWDRYLCLTGDPMWIEGPDGEVKTSWT